MYIAADRNLDPVYFQSCGDAGPALNGHIYLPPPDSQHNQLQTTGAGVLQRVLCRHVCSESDREGQPQRGP